MAGNDTAASIHACAVRASRLAADGSTPAGATNGICSSGIIKLDLNVVLEAGDDIVVKNACGAIPYTWKDGDVLKRLDGTLTMTNPDVELAEMLTGGSLITATGNSIGYSAPAVGAAAPNGVCLEVWTKAITGSGPAATNPYWRWVFPHWVPAPESFALEGAAKAQVYKGPMYENANIGNGPNNDFPAGGTFTRTFSYYRDTALPTTAAGYVTIPAQI